MIRARVRSFVLVFAALQTVVVTGCYTMQPVAQRDFPAGMILSLNINDAGRVGLAGRMGQNITVVQGRLVQHDTAGYLLAVQEVQTFRDGTQVWSGERVQVRNEFVNQANERKFSRGKTAIVVGASIGIVVLLASQGIIGSFGSDHTELPSDTIASNKIPLFIKR